MRLTITDVQRAGFCAIGARSWFKARGLDFRSFMREGIEESELPDDALAQRVVRMKAERDGQ